MKLAYNLFAVPLNEYVAYYERSIILNTSTLNFFNKQAKFLKKNKKNN